MGDYKTSCVGDIWILGGTIFASGDYLAGIGAGETDSE
jgi:hypothetical protein